MNSTNNTPKTSSAETPADSLRDSTASSAHLSGSLSGSSTGASPGNSRPNSNSGIYDVSRMTNIKSPVDPFGHNVSHYTKAQAADQAKRSQSNSELVRGLLMAMAIPLVAGAAYLVFSGQELRLSGSSNSANGLKPFEAPDAIEREPAARATLPVPIPTEVLPATANSALPKEVTVSPSPRDLASAPQPLKLVLDAEGKLLSPYSVVLDENGDEVSRRELEETLVFLPTLPLGEFEQTRVLSTATVSKTFATHTQTRPFVYSEGEQRRITHLRSSAPEIKKVFDENQFLASSRLQVAPFAIDSFDSSELSRGNPSMLVEAKKELIWTRAAAFVRELSGDQSVERRLFDTLKLWAQTYKPSGNAKTELPLMDLLIAYNHVRHLLRTPEQAMIDDFFKGVVDAQFTRLKANKVYDANHAAHVYFATAVGYVIENSAFQLHGQTQYKLHADNSKSIKQDSYGTETVESLKNLFSAAYVLERAGTPEYQNANLFRAAAVLATASQSDPPTLLVETLAKAAYFRNDLYGRLPLIARAAGIPGTRFGSDEGAIMAAVRKPTVSLVPNPQANRLPTNAPTKLPVKRK